MSFVSGNEKCLEQLVGCVLGFVQVPPPGGPKMTFSMGAGDRHTLSPPTSETLPVTGQSVSILFNQLGELKVSAIHSWCKLYYVHMYPTYCMMMCFVETILYIIMWLFCNNQVLFVMFLQVSTTCCRCFVLC